MVKGIVQHESDGAPGCDADGLGDCAAVGVAAYVGGVHILNWGVVEGLANGCICARAARDDGGPDIYRNNIELKI